MKLKTEREKLSFYIRGTDEQCEIIDKAISYLPDKVKKYFLTDPITIFCEIDKSLGSYFNKESFKTRRFIFLNWTLWDFNNETIIFTILHEIAHAYKNHNRKNKNKKEREKEANKFAHSWIEKHHPRSIRKKYFKLKK